MHDSIFSPPNTNILHSDMHDNVKVKNSANYIGGIAGDDGLGKKY